ncbi:hypothetical protein [Actinophytocola sp. NPDC049390]|uniref:hypothetical protein n=1 Tax=Actinophytocola sp. NPDC049390 TaxID=3363894 RepID=UPI003787C2A7
MSAWALRDLVRHAEIKPSGLKHVLLEIAHIQGDKPQTWVTVPTLAALTGQGQSTVKKHTATAAERGLLSKTQRYNDSNLMSLNVEALRALSRVRDWDSQNPDVSKRDTNTHTPTRSQNLASDQIAGHDDQVSPSLIGDTQCESDTIGGLTWEQIDEYPPYADSSPDQIPDWAGPEAARLAQRSVPDSTPLPSRTSPVCEATAEASHQWTTWVCGSPQDCPCTGDPARLGYCLHSTEVPAELDHRGWLVPVEHVDNVLPFRKPA